MINIKLSQNYRLRSDRYNLILFKEEGGRKNIEGFYSSIQDAIQGFIDLKMKHFDCTSIFALLQAIKSLKTSLNNVLQPLHLKVVEGEK